MQDEPSDHNSVSPGQRKEKRRRKRDHQNYGSGSSPDTDATDLHNSSRISHSSRKGNTTPNKHGDSRSYGHTGIYRSNASSKPSSFSKNGKRSYSRSPSDAPSSQLKEEESASGSCYSDFEAYTERNNDVNDENDKKPSVPSTDNHRGHKNNDSNHNVSEEDESIYGVSYDPKKYQSKRSAKVSWLTVKLKFTSYLCYV